ncbi:hypothetical protein DFH94DRAFT_407393 [Russula ochroleuca]|jgi:hypothetical protein|uniref:Uncharacterized protein n=1 Tax=Russula ochroleuca TaxID=152965 RepID=A0A9P5MYJ2_9AGAM|nr:hypothetical protein DFH94DRAFT_407393 [Russula ochroleuca]
MATDTTTAALAVADASVSVTRVPSCVAPDPDPGRSTAFQFALHETPRYQTRIPARVGEASKAMRTGNVARPPAGRRGNVNGGSGEHLWPFRRRWRTWRWTGVVERSRGARSRSGSRNCEVCAEDLVRVDTKRRVKTGSREMGWWRGIRRFGSDRVDCTQGRGEARLDGL